MTAAHDPKTATQLRDQIDSGATGEKVDWPDPAAAPLETDAEASGNPPGAYEVKLADENHAHATPRRWGVGAILTYVLIASILLAAAVLIVIASSN